MMEEKKDIFWNFCGIIQRLRSKDGCPWDRKQTHDTLKACMIEEAYEVIEAIHILSENGDFSNLREELGDVLLQVVMQAQIASEEGMFTIEDVLQEISEKMIRRHPHVFGNAEFESFGQADWEKIKKQEKKSYQNPDQNELEQVPKAFPALLRTQKVLKKAVQTGEDLFTREQDESQIREEISKLQKLSPDDHLQAERIIGNALLHLTDLASQYQVNSEEALTECLEIFIKQRKDK